MRAMDRLTARSKTRGLKHSLKCLQHYEHFSGFSHEECCADHCWGNQQECTKCEIQEAIERLAEYEDTELTPAEIVKLKVDNDRLHRLLRRYREGGKTN